MKTKPEKPKQRSRYQQCLPVEMNFHEQKQTPEHTRARSIHRRRHRFLDSGFWILECRVCVCVWFIYELHLNWRIWCNEFERKKEEETKQNQNKFFWIVADVDVKICLFGLSHLFRWLSWIYMRVSVSHKHWKIHRKRIHVYSVQSNLIWLVFQFWIRQIGEWSILSADNCCCCCCRMKKGIRTTTTTKKNFGFSKKTKNQN